MTRQDQINAWWEHKKQVYPYECFLPFIYTETGRISPNPEEIFRETQLDFISTPTEDKLGRKYAFRTEHDLLSFQKLFGATTS